MIVKYVRRICNTEKFDFAYVLEKQNYCCEKIRKAVQNDFYIDHELQTAEIQCYDHENQIIKYCWNCGQKLEIECVGIRPVGRNSEGVMVVIGADKLG
jgi:hypothetical protein